MPEKPAPSRSVTLSQRQLLLIGVVAVVVIAVAVTVPLVVTAGGKKAAAGAKTGVPTSGNGSCTWRTLDNPVKLVAKPPAKVATSGTVTVKLTTSQGPMTFTLDRTKAPCTVASFVSLAEQGFFADSPCHRVTTSDISVVQCGDPAGSGTGYPGYAIPDEATGSEQYPAGTLAMARTAEPGSGGSQFFIVWKDSPTLNRHLGTLQYTVFGTVTTGLSVVEKIGRAGATTGTDGRPKLPLQLLTVTAR